MVGAWLFVDESGARASAAIAEPNARRGVRFVNCSLVPWPDAVCERTCYLYDPTSPAGRNFLWGFLQSGYVASGVLNFWCVATTHTYILHLTSYTVCGAGSTRLSPSHSPISRGQMMT